VVIAYFSVMSHPWAIEVNHENLRTGGLRAEIRTWDLTTPKQECLITPQRRSVPESHDGNVQT